MKLHYAGASPFVRKALIVAHELGLADRIELATQAVTPVAPAAAVVTDNPLGKIPALVLDDGMVLFDSRVITEYLNELGGGRLLPADQKERWRARVLEAQGDGMNDALVLTRYETFLRPEHLRWQDWVDNQIAKATRSMDQLERTFDEWSSTLSIGTISIACALDYADFRFPDLGWRNGRPSLTAWQAEMASRSSFRETKPA